MREEFCINQCGKWNVAGVWLYGRHMNRRVPAAVNSLSGSCSTGQVVALAAVRCVPFVVFRWNRRSNQGAFRRGSRHDHLVVDQFVSAFTDCRVDCPVGA